MVKRIHGFIANEQRDVVVCLQLFQMRGQPGEIGADGCCLLPGRVTRKSWLNRPFQYVSKAL
jgi:hypothetical protein